MTIETVETNLPWIVGGLSLAILGLLVLVLMMERDAHRLALRVLRLEGRVDRLEGKQ